ncbi:PadR family transcriptional regulator [Sphingobacterium allocomposti]|jgi:PadR family transcriptional regulator PadR|uniref:PadR family transcriptional regulator n=1 Tax=Sphingobacterium allocomposti TaxID=415956 RepID=A0A5S5DLS9_9SPHI|nr:PadR family transcriptional regulator [Sphingobacterium composti Yoo et al. 2007 non Ten et al. 2007]TYP96801.1 PadR family transcriptional regulator [Sphingobacterium composti Yoo et al. 2007 non Ten et al. 2007]HLS93979.1 PadR family transcriptional regulator [Sphingobacterium sp.]
MSKHIDTDLDELLKAWEDTYKKGQLTLWIFLALKEEPKYVEEIRTFVVEKSQGSMSCEEQSLYRVLRKFEHVEIVGHELRKGNKGPDRKYYFLTELGVQLFHRFVERNIHIFFQDDIKSILV